MPVVKPVSAKAEYILQEEEKQWCVSEIPVLKAVISIPHCTANHPTSAQKRLNRYYRQCSRSFLSYCSRYLYPRAASDFERCTSAGTPFVCPEAAYASHISCVNDQILSVYTDCSESFSSTKELIVRYADTWDLRTGRPITAKECFPQNTKFKKRCIAAAMEHCQMQSAAGLCVYRSHLPVRLKRCFNSRNFYLSDAGFHFFYQPYAIAPPSEGFPTFCLPFSEEEGPVWPVSISS